ncbi:hypothetical protein HPB51_007398 [Rhipicephalus microplus]|uniref:RNase H type-1 domain-containing protein n=1 Tax=Rhipicephalus microplus TaxID=6941 RepID=A0A9J6EZU3_RHIMP|nr:hypothetical protein HPB51_007398 [Rhipicephalus microplus]
MFGRATSIVATGRFWVLDASTAYCTEVGALTKALQYLRSSLSCQTGHIYTDCLSVLQALVSPQCLDPRIVRIRELIRQISSARSHQVFHVPGHGGVFGNELTDFAALRACQIGLRRQAHLSVRKVKLRLRRALFVI